MHLNQDKLTEALESAVSNEEKYPAMAEELAENNRFMQLIGYFLAALMAVEPSDLENVMGTAMETAFDAGREYEQLIREPAKDCIATNVN